MKKKLYLTLFAVISLLINTISFSMNESAKGYIDHKSIPNEAFFKALEENNIDLVKKYINSGLSPNCKNTNGCPALIQATLKNFFEIVEFLLKQNANPNIIYKTTDKSTTALVEALTACNFKIIKLLLIYGADCNLESAHKTWNYISTLYTLDILNTTEKTSDTVFNLIAIMFEFHEKENSLFLKNNHILKHYDLIAKNPQYFNFFLRRFLCLLQHYTYKLKNIPLSKKTKIALGEELTYSLNIINYILKISPTLVTTIEHDYSFKESLKIYKGYLRSYPNISRTLQFSDITITCLK